MATRRPQLLTSSLRTISAAPYVSPLRCAISQSRSFRNAAVLQQGINQGMRASAQAQPSMRVLLAKHMQDNIPSDIGLLPHTFIMPRWSNRPSLFGNPKERFTLTKGFVKSKLGTIMEMMIFKWKSPMKLKLGEPKKDFAKKTYQEMYQHLAEGDIEKLKGITGSGLMDKLIKQIMARPRLAHQKLVWNCRDLKATRVSNRAFHFWGQGIEMRQAVFRMESYQQLKRVKTDPRNPSKIIGEAPGKQSPERKVVEYVVFQKRKIGDTPESSWYLWGSVDETTPDQYREMVRNQPGHIA
ncbi:hypothetical protein BJ508DRAFT_98291 [Ascobolus immersus RN42]|uniref:Tim44-like domain-containing protein n=1 Tax=Ascobolus immersus RN42 TaxID=1160509 RepID=A0A3N4IMF1_ASCIM|nr:hypothetical protein BJ508DRAFT_98291 [Ascobolus immersus RN42]